MHMMIEASHISATLFQSRSGGSLLLCIYAPLTAVGWLADEVTP